MIDGQDFEKRLIDKSGLDAALAMPEAIRQRSDIIRGIATLLVFFESQSNNVVFVAATGKEGSCPKFVHDASLPAAELFSVSAVGLVAKKWEVASFSNGPAQIVALGVGGDRRRMGDHERYVHGTARRRRRSAVGGEAPRRQRTDRSRRHTFLTGGECCEAAPCRYGRESHRRRDGAGADVVHEKRRSRRVSTRTH